MIFFYETYVFGMLLCSIIYWTLIPRSHRDLFLIIISAAGLFYIQPCFTLFLFVLVYFIYAMGLLVRDCRKGNFLGLGISVLAILFIGLKYVKPFLGYIFSNEPEFIRFLVVPLGLSYFSFKLIAFLIDVYRGIIVTFSYRSLLNFTFFLPTFPAGPIETFQKFESTSQFNIDFYCDGLQRIVYGYAKKVFLINIIFNEVLIKRVQPEILANITLDLPFSQVFIFLLLALLYSYIDLSAYADLAIGFSRLFGYKIIEDMNKPVLRSNLGDFWQAWHISLSSWCRNNVYFPVLGKTRRNNLALYCSFLTMGLWHNISLNWAFWGIWHASGLILYNLYSRRKRKFLKKNKRFKNLLPKKIGQAFGIAFTCSFVAIGYGFIFLDGKFSIWQDPIYALKLLMAMFF